MSATTACHQCPLRALPAFRVHSAREVDFIQSQKVGELTFRAGTTIQVEGQKGERLFTVLSGWAFRYKSLPDGRRQILNFLLPGDLIGLQAKLFNEASHGVEALTQVVLCTFARDRTWEVFQTFPDMALELTWLCAAEERLVDEGLLSVGRRTALERVAVLILGLWKRASGLGMVSDGVLAVPLTQQHIADALGLSAVHTNRTLQALRRRKLFDLGNGTLSRVDEDGLARLGHFNPQSEARPLY